MKNYYTLFCLALALTFSTLATAQVIYYEEDFNAGANGWTSISLSPTDTSVWIWDELGFVGNGAITAQFIDPNLAITGTTNPAAMVMNADYYTTLGDPDNIPTGPPSTYPKYISELISPLLDLTGIVNAMSIEWTQLVTILNVSPGASFRTSLQWSTDGGLTWSDPVDANEDKEINTVYNGDVQTIPIPDIQGEPNVQIKFTFSSDFYHWVIDDVKLIERESHNMRTNENFFAIAPNINTPVSQVEEFGFLCDIENIGGQPQTGVVLSITIDEDGGGQVYFDTEDYGTIGIDSVAENVSFGGFTPDPVEASYTGVYEVTADSTDLDPSDNSIEWNFEVVESIFAKEEAPDRSIYPAEDNWNVGDPRSWAYGNHYHIVNGTGYFANSATFSIDVSDSDGPDQTGQVVRVGLYEWDDDNMDGNADPEERSLVALSNYTITGDEEFDELITVPLTDLFTGNSVQLDDNTDYALMLEFFAEDETRVDFAAGDVLDYGAMILNSEQQGTPRYASLLGISGDLESEPWSSAGFGSNFQVVTRLHVEESPLFTSAQEILDDANTIAIFPNPAEDQVTLNIELQETSSELQIDMLDLAGRLISSNQMINLRNFSTEINVANLPSGTYFVRISTDFGVRTERLIVK